MIEGSRPDKTIDRLVVFHKALADETRVRIVNLLLEKPCCVKELSLAMNIPQPRVSQHLNVLRSAGMVGVEKKGTMRCYSLDFSIFYEDLFDCVINARKTSPLLLADLEKLEE